MMMFAFIKHLFSRLKPTPRWDGRVFCPKHTSYYIYGGKCGACAAEEEDPLSVIFSDARCPDCGCDKLITWHDMGHDVCVTCKNCRAAFGLQTSPFNIAERIKDRLGEQGV